VKHTGVLERTMSEYRACRDESVRMAKRAETSEARVVATDEDAIPYWDIISTLCWHLVPFVAATTVIAFLIALLVTPDDARLCPPEAGLKAGVSDPGGRRNE